MKANRYGIVKTMLTDNGTIEVDHERTYPDWLSAQNCADNILLLWGVEWGTLGDWVLKARVVDLEKKGSVAA